MSLDFNQFLAECGLTQSDMDRAEAAMPEPLPMFPGEQYRLAPSSIQGIGVFASAKFGDGSHVATLRIGHEWTQAGRYMNHSAHPNCVVAFDGNTVLAHACAHIQKGDEMTVNYQQVRSSMTHVEK